MDKFQAGDKVRILPREDGQENQYPSYVDVMTDFAGQIAIIQCRTEERCYHLVDISAEDGFLFWWHEDWLEPIPKKKRKFL